MRKRFLDYKTGLIYLLILIGFLIVPLIGNRAVTTLAEISDSHKYVIIDAGHGGVDGGAVSCTGVDESQINLEIALKLEDLMHLLGIRTVMIRDTDRSVYTEGETIAAKKVSDIKERVRIVNTTPNALFISIHQNNFQDARYSGTQVFYNNQSDSKQLATELQTAFRENLNPSNKRQIKKTSGVYLMEHINCTGVLIECGFLSNYQEEAMLRDPDYQRKICSVISITVSRYLNT
ncbi:MAG: N-acetylmuramoyl-L-alanine amidase [Oscillospiraceae bacterium]|nr:N-acetylmuramoyl-L-alanine amidase [Oscillospiraceae bacterium]